VKEYCDLTEIVKRLDAAYIEATSDDEKAEMHAMRGLRLSIRNFILQSEHYKCIDRKIGKIAERTHNCSKCINGEEKKFECRGQILTFVGASNRSVCLRCCERMDALNNVRENIEDNALSVIKEEHVKLKVIINKLTQKLRNYDAR
jgi:hypothetical protein